MNENGMMPAFDELFKNHNWRPIRGCEGRYVLSGGPASVSLRELTGEGARIERFDGVKPGGDAVWVAYFEGGGLISYEKSGGIFIHTLNTPEGLKRKIEELGINR